MHYFSVWKFQTISEIEEHVWLHLDFFSSFFRRLGRNNDADGHYWCKYVISIWGPSWSWSYGSWIYNYLCNQCLSPLMLWVRISIGVRCTTLCDKVCQWVATGRWFSPGSPVSSTNKTDRHDITEILLKVALNTIKQTNKQQT